MREVLRELWRGVLSWTVVSLRGEPHVGSPHAHDVSEAEFCASIVKTQMVLGRNATPCFRPPEFRLAAGTRELVRSLGLRLVMSTVNPRDWQQPGAEVLAGHIVGVVVPGSVVVLHDGLAKSNRDGQLVEALDMALGVPRRDRPSLRGRGNSRLDRPGRTPHPRPHQPDQSR